jgi:transposase InsO family protein
MKRKKRQEPRAARGPTTYEVKVRMVREVLRGGRQADVATAFGVSVAALQKYMSQFRAGGLEALRPRTEPRRRPPSKTPDPRREAVVRVKRDNPSWGTRRIRDVLARFEALGISETVVRRVLHEEGLIESRPPATTAREHPVRRFERAAPNQLWQSDIFTFLLRKHERLYVAAFMDDHSRYLVSLVLAHHQKSSLVLEAFERGVAAYGTPEEVLTDQGRQYTAWRGQTAFEDLLRQHGIRHAKSRPQHPQTLGKIERFWKTLWEEHLSRTVFADFADCERRIGLFVQHYNFQRPHQALGGLVPADRFFRTAPEVRATIEAQVAANALRLARSQPPRKPFYLVGRVGDQALSIAAQAGRLEVQMGGAAQTIELGGEPCDEADETERASREAVAADATVADGPLGSGSGGAAPLPDDPQRPVGGEAGNDGGGGARDLAGPLLPARDAGAGGGAAGGGSGGGQREQPRGCDEREAGGGARGQGGKARAGEAAIGAAPLSDAADRAAGSGEDVSGAADDEGVLVDAEWLARFAAGADGGEEDRGRDTFDADEGWRGRAMSWERKLAGEAAPWEGDVVLEDDDGAEAEAGGEVELPEGADGPESARGASDGGAGGDRQADVGQRGGAAPGNGAPQLPDDRAPRGGGAPGLALAATGREDAAAGERGGPLARERAPQPREREAERAAPDDGSPPRRGGRGDPWAETTGAAEEPVDELVRALGALLERRGPGPRSSGPAGEDLDDAVDPSDDDD